MRRAKPAARCALRASRGALRILVIAAMATVAMWTTPSPGAGAAVEPARAQTAAKASGQGASVETIPVGQGELRTASADSTAPPAQQTGKEPFDTIGATWSATESLALQVRVHTAAGWAEWFALDESDNASDGDEGRRAPDQHSSDPRWVGTADGFEVQAPPGMADVQVRLVRAGTQPEAVTQADYLPGGAPPVIRRAEWGARPPASSADYASTIKMAFVHHTVNANDYSPGDVPAMLRSIQAFHQDANGWKDIGYNFVVDRFGRIWEAREGGIDKAVVGAHTGGFNTTSVGISMLGDFTVAAPTAAAVQAVAEVVGWKLGVSGVSPYGTATLISGENSPWDPGTAVTFNTVSGHRDAYPTGCPGQRLYDRLADIRDLANQTAAVVANSPFGHLDVHRQEPSGLHLAGWVIDSNAPSGATQAHIYVDGVGTALDANLRRDDVGAVFTSYGPNHGFDLTLTVRPGLHQVCVYGFNVGAGLNTQLDCMLIPIIDDPFGSLDIARVEPGGVHLAGWILDPNSAASTQIHVYQDGVGRAFTASMPRPDVAAQYPTYGAAHGFDIMVPLPAGGLCAYAFNLLQGQSTLVGCPGLSSNPFGSLDVIGPAPGGIRAAGWIIDPNTAASTEVHVYVNGIGYRFSANGGRGDVSAVYPPWGASHGFDVTVPGVEGQNDVCVYAFNLGAGTTSPLLGCRSYTLSHRPYGSFDVVYQSNGTRRAAGWAIDPDTAQPIAVHLYVGSVVTPAVANGLRADVGALAPFYGARHGFDSPVPVGNVVCAYAINVGSGENVGLGCRDG